MIKYLTIFGAALAVLPSMLLPQSASAVEPLRVPISSCPGRTVTGFVGDFPRGPTGDAAPGEMRQFLGIRYAAPPTGGNRWHPPKPFCWNGNRAAQAFGEVCPQRSGGDASGQEDCLFLNVFAPATGNYSNLPVMVLIHDGAFTSGKGSFWTQNPVDLVKQGVVVVTFNYRLGALGFLAHPKLDKIATKNTGNYGFLDQQEALKWVRKNIAAFGGDPKNVTVFGSSAGGISVLIHLVSPLSKGLFDKAIIQSGSLYQRPQTLNEAERLGVTFAQRVGCTTAACLRRLPVSTILAHQIAIERGDIEMFRIDGVVLRRPVMDLLMAGQFHKVPIINGSNRDESGQFHENTFIGDGDRCAYTSNLVPNRLATFPGAVSYHDALVNFFGRFVSFPPKVEPKYPPGQTAKSANAAFIAMKTDFNRACRTLRVHDWISDAGGTLFAYEFSDAEAPNFLTGPFKYHNGARFDLGAYIGAETQYLFRMPRTVLCRRPYEGLRPGQKSLAADMVKYWTTFAKTGNPNSAGGNSPPVWPRYTNSNRQMLSLQSPTPKVMSAGTFDRAHKCSSFWNDLIE